MILFQNRDLRYAGVVSNKIRKVWVGQGKRLPSRGVDLYIYGIDWNTLSQKTFTSLSLTNLPHSHK